MSDVPVGSHNALCCPECKKHPPLRLHLDLIMAIQNAAENDAEGVVGSIRCNSHKCGNIYYVKLEDFHANST